MTSLSRSALIWTTILLAGVGAVAFVIAYEMARREAADFLDGQLRQIALNAGQGLDETAVASASPDPEDEFVIAMWNAAGEPLRKPAIEASPPSQSSPGFATVTIGGEAWRVFVASDSYRTVQVAQRMSVRDEMAQTAALQAGLPILAAIPLAWLVIGWSLSRVLWRLTNLASDIASRGAESQEPILLARVPKEVLPLATAMNGLIARLQQAVAQQKRFVSDAAHELRTPLAALQIQIDNLKAQTSPDDLAPTAELSAGVRRASMLVEQLLRVARLEGPLETTPAVAVDLNNLVTQCVADFVLIADSKGVDLGMAASSTAVISGWPDDLRTLFGNLIDNAVRYTPTGGTVDVSVRRSGSSAVVEVMDTGCGIPDEHLPKVFDRFFRWASADIDGSGLGLSIANAVAKRHGLKIEIRNRSDRSGIRVQVLAMGLDL